ncbi:ABC transporter permease [Parabacteroides sp. PF5-9]|uniref:ABC transporter permease n=1 Tax=Parabacteroides sp. PF5-9 TaxID=1742404 RepID=UPI0024750268|nr:ABC transporter permease [Parabacteroides sp. PF5-9]MDH6359265.1 putative ABC transport system permease protein [Parabacteroides sp. PF5-9]
MFDFLLKGILRDRRRSLLPVLVVTIGVFVVVSLDGLMGGMMNNMVDMTANFQTGHMRVMTRAYSQDEDQKPNDLALMETDILTEKLKAEYPEVDWTPRILFGGLLDIPDANGETMKQGPVAGQAFDLLNPDSRETERTGLKKALTAGHLINRQGEALVSHDFADKFGLIPGDTVTFFGSTMYGSMTFQNYTIAGIVRFGNSMLDKGGIIIDMEDARQLLDMENAAGEILGFLPDGYDTERARLIKNSFNSQYADQTDEYAPVMMELADDPMMGQTLSYTKTVSFFMIFLLVLALSIVLWNAGVLGGIRRYNEFGIRLAMGEKKWHIYSTLLAESLMIGCIGSVFGTILGIWISLYLKKYGMDYSNMMETVSMMIDPVIRSDVMPRMYFIGFIPGIISTLIGTALSGRAIYKRSTALLFKELD